LSAADDQPARLNPIVAERFADRLRAFARPWEIGVFIWLPLIILSYTVWYELHAHTVLEDFGIFRVAADAVIHGRTPFVAADPHALAHFDKFVYPPSTALFFAPFAVLPLHVSQVAMFGLSLGCTLAALRLLDVRDSVPRPRGGIATGRFRPARSQRSPESRSSFSGRSGSGCSSRVASGRRWSARRSAS
jgi:hypothetical protein